MWRLEGRDGEGQVGGSIGQPPGGLRGPALCHLLKKVSWFRPKESSGAERREHLEQHGTRPESGVAHLGATSTYQGMSM